MNQPAPSHDTLATPDRPRDQQAAAAWLWRRRLHNLLYSEAPTGSPARALRMVLCGSAALSVVLYGLDIARGLSHRSPEPLLFVLHVLTTAIFCADYLARMYVAAEQPDSPGAFAARLAALRQPEMLLEAVTLLPFFLGLWLPVAIDLRFLRAIRFMQLVPSRSLARSRATIVEAVAHAWPVTLAVGLSLAAAAITVDWCLCRRWAAAPGTLAAAGSSTGLVTGNTPLAFTLVFFVLLLLVLFAGLLLVQQRNGRTAGHGLMARNPCV
jgi:hypothetical protein